MRDGGLFFSDARLQLLAHHQGPRTELRNVCGIIVDTKTINIMPVSTSLVYISENCLFPQDKLGHFWPELLACLSWFSLYIWPELSMASLPLVKGKRLAFGWQQVLLVQRSKEATAVEAKTARSM